MPTVPNDVEVPEEMVPVQTDNTEREGIDPVQDISQDPELDYTREVV